MKAVVITVPGPPEVLTLQDLPVPKLGSDDLLIHLKAAGINPLDTKLRERGPLVPSANPVILGCDGSGVITAIGSEVTRFQVGDEVYFCHGGIGSAPGTYAEYAILNEHLAARKPESLSFLQAAAAPLVCITAWESLHDRGRIQSGQKILVHGGAGGVGHVAVQMARIAGAQVCATVGSFAQAAFLRTLGVDHVIFYQEQDFVEAVLDWTQGEGVHLALDTVGGSVFFKTLECIQPYGDIVTLLQPKEGDWSVARQKNLRISIEWMPAPLLKGWSTAQQHQRWILEQCGHLCDTGQLRIQVAKFFPLEQASDAHRFLEQEEVIGKVVLEISPF